MKLLFTLALSALSVNAYWLVALEDFISTARQDPVVNLNKMVVSSHAHSIMGGSNFGFNTTTASLRKSECTSVPIPQDKSSYWFPHLYFQWKNGSFTSLDGGAVIDTPGTTTAFPDDFRMISGDPSLRTYTATSAQKAITFLCLDFNGKSVTYNQLPSTPCPNGVRAQINFPSCWDGKNTDSVDHKSHVAFLSGGPDSGTCNDPKYPVTLPRIFMEVYWDSNAFDNDRPNAMNSTQPFVYAQGDPTGYGYHADFINGWDKGVLQNAVDKCNCDHFGDPTCCVNQGIFDMNKGQQCRITNAVDEKCTGTLLKLPGNNPVQHEGKTAIEYVDNVSPPFISPVYAYTGASPTATGKIVTPAQTNVAAAVAVASVVVSATSSTSTLAMPISSSTSVNDHVAAAATLMPSNSVPITTTTALSSSSSSVAPAAPKSTSSDPPEACGIPKRRQLDNQNHHHHHRHHRRLSHVRRHDFFYEATN